MTGSEFPRVFRVAPLAHELQLLRVDRIDHIAKLRSKVKNILPTARGDLLVLLADQTLANSTYENSDQLVWRDGGALMQTLHFAASAYRIAFCPIGISGTELVTAILESESCAKAVGVAVVGRDG